MPFGKHRGEFIEDVPHSYLMWVLKNCSRINPEVRQAIADELDVDLDDYPIPPDQEYRPPGGRYSSPPPPPPPSWSARSGDRETMLAEIQRLRRKHAATLHPDRGGSDEAMKGVNAFADDLIDMVKRCLG